jgi:hypothetical protein
MRREAGQASVEWVALVLLGALLLGGAAATALGREDREERELGSLVARRIAGVPGAALGAPGPAARTRAVAPGAQAAVPRAPAAAPPRASAPTPSSRTANALHRLRGLSAVAKRAWIVCLGHRRWRYQLEHPLAPNETLPLDEALAMANTCLNPYSFLMGD